MEQIITNEMIDLEAVCVRMKLSDSYIFIHCVYIQPSSSMNTYMAHLSAIDSIEKQRNERDIGVYCGDWNLPEVNWIEDEDSYSYLPIIGDSENAKSTISRHVTTHMLDTGLFQICDFKNTSNNVLDLCYTNMPELAIMERSLIPLIPNSKSDKSHTQSVCLIECQPKALKLNSISTPVFCFKKANYDAINEALENADFSSLNDCDDVDETLDMFYNVINGIIHKHVPQSTIRTSNKPQWSDKLEKREK